MEDPADAQPMAVSRRRKIILAAAGLMAATTIMLMVAQSDSTAPLVVSTRSGETVLVAQPEGAGCWVSSPYTICENASGDLNVTPGSVIATKIDGTPCWEYDVNVVRPEVVTFAACTPPTTTTDVPTTTVAGTTTTVTPTTTPTTTTPPSGAGFVETFDTPDSLDRFDWAVHHAWTFGATKQQWPGDHNLACDDATTTRTVNNPTTVGVTYAPDLRAGVVYWCRQHMMTSFNTNHYAQVDFAPKPVITDVNRVCWDQNRTNLGSRHWTQLAVVPLSTFTANNNRLDYVSSRFSPSGPGKYGLHPTDSTLLVEFGRGKPRVQIGQAVQDINGLAWSAESDRRVRYQHCVVNTGTGLRIEIANGIGINTAEVYNYSGRIPSGPVRVIFQHDLYNPDKSPGTPNAYTWHWDNITIG